MVKPTLEEIRASDLTPLERELALASFGAEALADVPAAVTPAAAAVAAIDAALRDPAHGHPAKGVAASRESAVSSNPASPPPAPAPYDPALDSNPHMQAWRGRLDALRARNAIAKPMRACGRLTRAAGLVLEAVGLRLSVGAEVMIELPFGSSLAMAEAEVVGFSGDKLFLMPTTEVIGLLPGARVYPLESAPIADPMAGAKRLPVGWELLGRVLDASGRPLDGLGPLGAHADAPLSSPVINPLNREPIHKVLDVGVRAINALLTVGRGQRMGLFAGSGVGKSVLLGTMARYTSAEVIVIGLIGERGREVKEFIEQILGEEGLARSVVIAAPADVSPLLRMQAASYSTSLAEYFRDQGKHVLLLMDSLTRYAMAQREIALAVGEPPATKGYPPSVFAKLPALVERTGNGPAGGGSITAFYTVLTEGDDQQDPIADSARAILDGHIVLSRSLAEAGHYPAIDIEASISRAMTALIDDNHLEKTRMFKQMLSRYQRNRDLINVGAYSSGRDALLDRAIALYPRMEAFLQQGFRECANFEPSLEMLDALFAQGG
ncbi:MULTISPECIES: flagellar protein export ATPase FliI [Paraburkholderia]|uniref:flagellar protein export ATPase FliI n=1 Tax=Paraburkholderia TaxID=1822464 RepID=UPI00224D7306|nr:MULTISPECIES: flagellar protein export ATPase FliI [Paraburkholderia]MCX4159466.1 flagellar protein export ATPase FliI [Paraburkholderia aspalathi]MDN7168865.1 flagellar protein export ATPase FliI [Paraburkholderia sp. SECH2]MDQ6397352.1 flagellar protein export ATPase FliI [Paraburkholderia aspalathi]